MILKQRLLNGLAFPSGPTALSPWRSQGFTHRYSRSALEIPPAEDSVTNHRLKAKAFLTGCKPSSGQRPAQGVPHQAGFKREAGHLDRAIPPDSGRAGASGVSMQHTIPALHSFRRVLLQT